MYYIYFVYASTNLISGTDPVRTLVWTQMASYSSVLNKNDSVGVNPEAKPVNLEAKPENDRIKNIKVEIENVQSTMRSNINAAISRGESISILEQKSKDLDDQAAIFHRKSRHLKCQEQCRSYRVIAILLVIVALVILILYFAIKN